MPVNLTDVMKEKKSTLYSISAKILQFHPSN